MCTNKLFSPRIGTVQNMLYNALQTVSVQVSGASCTVFHDVCFKEIRVRGMLKKHCSDLALMSYIHIYTAPHLIDLKV